MTESIEPARHRFFGRTKGKALRAGQRELLERRLPALMLRLPPTETAVGMLSSPGSGGVSVGHDERPMPPLEALFETPMRAFRLEIGFGGGEHLVHRALENPDIGFIGVEPFLNGMAKLVVEIEARRLTNIRVFDQDATLLLRGMPAASLDEIALLYPDPWPKRRQRKRRFVSLESLALIARALKPGGLFRFASDIDDYVGWTLARAAAEPALRWAAEAAPDWTIPYPGWPGTRYEAKARLDGRRSSYLTFTRL